jgi:phosphoribosylformimino-5-aminoimidazole carboxamide ribotide isomerase
MNIFKIIPVIDILNSIAVHAKKGERTQYKPLKSKLFRSSNPVKIIRKIRNEYDLHEFYIADLDSIINKNPNYQLLKEISDISNIEIMLDPGIADINEINFLNEFRIKSLIIGLETIKSFEVVRQSLEILRNNKIIISIDMYKGEILSNAKDIINQDPIDIIKNIESLGIRRIILLDLYRVGQKIGGIPPLYLDILDNFEGDIFVGGGIKNLKDILEYKEQNFSGVLVATALYDGTIDIKKLRKL